MKDMGRKILDSLWSQPDPVLLGAGLAGERFVAKVRIALTGALLLIPVVNNLAFQMIPHENAVGLGLTLGSFLLSWGVYFLVAHEFHPRRLSFVSSCFDVSLVSAALAVFLLLNQPHTAVNSKVVFEGYFLAIGATSLRYDKRVCITAGLLAIGEYLALVSYAAAKWDLNSPAYSPFPYGMFGWSNQISRLILMMTASALSIAIVSRSHALLRLATTDSLTGLYNRGYMDDRFVIELGRARRYGHPLTVALMDADCFKRFNDTHGHAAGDLALRTIAETLTHSFRQSDTAGRYGGEEFVVVMPETDIETARRKMESLRSRIAGTLIELSSRDETVSITVSAGLAGFPRDGSDAAELLATADARLFQAKREGRNRVVASLSSNPICV